MTQQRHRGPKHSREAPSRPAPVPPRLDDLPASAAPWYVAGLAFECAQCGRCCAGPEEGYIWITKAEIKSLAAHLGIDVQEMMDAYVRRVAGRFSLREVEGSHDCIFLETAQGGQRGCRIYHLRPAQCRTWPFWDANLQDPGSWALAGFRCRGINRGKRFGFEDIEIRRKATHGGRR